MISDEMYRPDTSIIAIACNLRHGSHDEPVTSDIQPLQVRVEGVIACKGCAALHIERIILNQRTSCAEVHYGNPTATLTHGAVKDYVFYREISRSWSNE